MDAKARLGPDDAIRIARSASSVKVAKGKAITSFDMKKDNPDDDALLAKMLGPTGNLRAPTLRIGKTVIVGFSDSLYREELL